MSLSLAKKIFARSLLVALPILPVVASSPAVADERPAKTPAATEFVTRFGGQLVAILNNTSMSVEQKAQAILPLLQKNVDIEGIGKYCLGRYWNTATPEQRKQYMELFHMVLLKATTAQVGNYQNVSIRVVRQMPSPNGTKVTALVMRPNQPVLSMVVVVAGNPFKVTDLFGEGASMKLTERSDYTSFLSRHNGNVQTLIETLQAHMSEAQHAAAPTHDAKKSKKK